VVIVGDVFAVLRRVCGAVIVGGVCGAVVVGDVFADLRRVRCDDSVLYFRRWCVVID
jgi:hypothetical protein